MPTPDELKNALFVWAMTHDILNEDAMRDAAAISGDQGLVPFDPAHAEFFRTRKIVRITASRKARSRVFTLFARLPIAKTKIAQLQKAFSERYGENDFLLDVEVAQTFKIDQNVLGTHNPIYYHGGRFACGSSVGLGNQRNAGTLTALAQMDDGGLLGISCNHVTGGCNTARRGTPIVVPGIQDVSPEHHEIAVIGVHDFTGPMSQGLPEVHDISSNCDIAFFQINTDQAMLLSSMQGEGAEAYDTPTKFATVKEDLNVKKWGRTTGRTRGKLKRIVLEAEPVPYKVISYYGPTSSQVFTGTVFFTDFYEVVDLTANPFSAGGDSGSLVVTDQDGGEKIVGILIGGKSGKSYVLPLKKILKAHRVNLVSGHNI